MISPQNGHILGVSKFVRPVFFPKSFLSESALELSQERTRIRCIDGTKWSYGIGKQLGAVTVVPTDRHFPGPRQSHHDTSSSPILCKIAQSGREPLKTEPPYDRKSEQFRSAIPSGLGDHETGDLSTHLKPRAVSPGLALER